MAIKIGFAQSLSNPENWNISPNDRQQMVETLDGDGVVVIDNGRFPLADVISFKATFPKADFLMIKDYWRNREKVHVECPDGTVYENVRVILKSYSYRDKFTTYYDANLELWRV